jgi:hypothetical protein
VLYDFGRKPFFPDPHELAARCEVLRAAERSADEARRYLDELAEWKAQCARERAEDAEAEAKRETAA